MRRQQALQASATTTQQPQRRAHRTYTIAQLLQELEIPRRTFFHLRRTGQLPFLEELRPRLGRVARYRADLVDQYLAGTWNRTRTRTV